MNHPDEVDAMVFDMRNAEIIAHAAIHHCETADLDAVLAWLVDPDGDYRMSQAQAEAWMREYTELIITYAPSIFELVKLDVYKFLQAARKP